MKKKKPGFTLLELIIAMMITITVIGIAGSMLTTGNKVFNDSDVKSTLQIEGQSLQEKISNIGMQGTQIMSLSPNIQAGAIDYLIIKSYVKDDDNPRYFKIQKDQNKLILNEDTNSSCSNINNNQVISEDIDSFTINCDSTGKSVNFDIKLKKSRGYSSDVGHEINFTINFRNKGN